MIRKGLAVAVILLFIGMCIVPSSAVKEFKEVSTVGFDGNTLYVGGSGPNNYTTIQGAIDDAVDGDTVFVFDDSSPYFEHVNIGNDKSIRLIGEDKNTTIIDGESIGWVVNIQSDNCIVSGFNLINCGDSYPNDLSDMIIKCNSDYNIISNNILSINDLPEMSCWVPVIYLEDSSYNLIENNMLIENDDTGLKLGIIIVGDSSYNVISNNYICGYYIGGADVDGRKKVQPGRMTCR